MEPQQSITNQNHPKFTTPDQVPDTTMKTRAGEAIQGHSHIFTDTAAQVVRVPIEAILDHGIGILTIITGVAHDAQIPHTGAIAIDLAVTPHIDHTADHLHTGTHHTTPEIEACHVHIHPTNPHNEPHIGHTHTPVDHEANHITRRTPE